MGKVRVCMVGFGGIARAHLKAYRVRFDDAERICRGTRLTVYPDDEEAFVPELEKKDRMAEEILCLGVPPGFGL